MTDEQAPTAPVPTPAPAPAAAEPMVQWAPPPAPVVVPGRRSTLAAAAGVVLIVLGVLGGIVALAILTIGRSIIDQFDFSNLPGMQDVQDPGGVINSVFNFVGILLLVFSAFYVIGGVGALRTAGWGRVIGIIIGIVGTLFWLPAIAGSGRVADANPVFAYVLLAAHIYAFVVLAFFWRNKPSVA
ncbi:MAG TPA: hypothetical protein VJ850_02310 [Candidatus Limnocylindrales bacterium]|nr:hypothetical protein [Candidatus Limnocylindrales bacterium]